MASAGDIFKESKLVDDYWITVLRPSIPFLLLELWSAAGPLGDILEWVAIEHRACYFTRRSISMYMHCRRRPRLRVRFSLVPQ